MYWSQTHSSKGVGNSQPNGGHQRRDESEGQETKHRQCENSTGHCEDPPQTHIILKNTHKSVRCYNNFILNDLPS